MCPQKHSIGALTREEVACPDCPMTNILPEMPSLEAGRIIHHVRWQHPVCDALSVGLELFHLRTWGLSRVL